MTVPATMVDKVRESGSKIEEESMKVSISRSTKQYRTGIVPSDLSHMIPRSERRETTRFASS